MEDQRVERDVALDAVAVQVAHQLGEFVGGEVDGPGTGVQPAAEAEIDGIRAVFHGSAGASGVAGRGQQLRARRRVSQGSHGDPLYTKHIVLWDTLLAKLDADQVLFVVAHEMGHYVLHHVLLGVAAGFFGILVGLYLVYRLSAAIMKRYKRRFGFDQLSDVASLPLIWLLVQLISLVVMPIGLAYSRYLEHEADRFGLELTQNNHAAASAFVRLQDENLANPRPSFLHMLRRGSHPSIGERIDFANSYRPWDAGQPLRYGRLFRGPEQDPPRRTEERRQRQAALPRAPRPAIFTLRAATRSPASSSRVRRSRTPGETRGNWRQIPSTRQRMGLCTSLPTCRRTASGRSLVRQLWAKAMKKRWSGVKPSRGDSFLSLVASLKAAYDTRSPPMSAMFSPSV